MSADNGIYILKTKDLYRVIHAQAIDNLWWSYIDKEQNNMVPTRLVEYYGNTRYTRNIETAQRVAAAMEKSCYICEYGIRTFEIHKTWRQIVQEAKELAPFEIEYLKAFGRGDSYTDYQIEKLEKVLQYKI